MDLNLVIKSVYGCTWISILSYLFMITVLYIEFTHRGYKKVFAIILFYVLKL